MIEYVEVKTGNVLDRFEFRPDGELTYETGEARPKVENLVSRFGVSGALAILSDWTNGYVSTREAVR